MKSYDTMTKIPLYSPFEGRVDVVPEVKTDRSGNLNIQLWCDDGPYLTLTKDLDKDCDPDCAFIDHLATGESLSDWLTAQGIGVRTGKVAYSGYRSYEEIQFNPEFLDCYRNGKKWENPEWVWCTAYRDSVLGGFPAEREDPPENEDNLITVAVKKEWLIDNLSRVFDMEEIVVPDNLKYLGDIKDKNTGEEFTTAHAETQVVMLAANDPGSGAFICKEFFLTDTEKREADRINFQARPDQMIQKKKKPKKTTKR